MAVAGGWRAVRWHAAYRLFCNKWQERCCLLSDTLGVSMLTVSLAQARKSATLEGATEATVEGPFYWPGAPDVWTFRSGRTIVTRFATDASQIVNSAEFREKYLTNLGFEPVGDTPDQFTAFLVNDRKIGAEKVKVSGAKLD